MDTDLPTGMVVQHPGSYLRIVLQDSRNYYVFPGRGRRIALVIASTRFVFIRPVNASPIIMITILNWVALLIAVITSIGLLLQRDWRVGLGLLAIQYLSIFWLVQTHWPISMAAGKLVTGWMACAVLGMAQLNNNTSPVAEAAWPQGRLFRIFTAGIISAATFALSLRASSWLGLSLPIAWGSLLLTGMGLLQLGISAQPFRVSLGLLTILAGFEILYAAVESSTLVAALLSAINLGLALAGAYLLNMSQEGKA